MYIMLHTGMISSLELRQKKESFKLHCQNLTFIIEKKHQNVKDQACKKQCVQKKVDKLF